MLQAPMDYSLNVIDPFAAGLAGFQMGQQNRMTEQNQQVNLADASQRQAMNAQGMEMNAQAMAQGATTFDQGQEDRAVAQQRQQAFADDQSALIEKFQSGKVTASDIAEFSAKYPELAAEMKASFDGLSVDRRKNDAFELAKAAAALKAGKPEVAIKMLEDRAVAAENAGLTDEAGMARAMIEQIKLDPAIGLTVAGLALHQLDPEGAKLVFGDSDNLTASQKDYNFYAKQETDAGRAPKSFNEWDLQSKKAGAASTTVTVGGTDSEGNPKVGPSLAEVQTGVDTAISLIDEIDKDPALAGVTGSLEGGGGNNVDEFGVAKRAYYGDAGLAVVQKIAQLQNTAWLAARDMLKGGGAITDYESKKAEGAMARLSRAQGDAEFKAALKDLRDAITEGAAKLKAAGVVPPADGSGSPPPAGPDQGPAKSPAGKQSLEDLMREAEGLSP